MRAALTALALLPAAALAQPPVEVAFGELGKFSDLRVSILSTERDRAGLAEELRRHLERSAAARLPQDKRLAVTILDVDMAGEYPPVTGSLSRDLRVVSDAYPPRITLEFRLLAADGSVEREGRRELRDAGFLWQAAPLNESDLLRFEKRLLDRWLGTELGRPR